LALKFRIGHFHGSIRFTTLQESDISIIKNNNNLILDAITTAKKNKRYQARLPERGTRKRPSLTYFKINQVKKREEKNADFISLACS